MKHNPQSIWNPNKPVEVTPEEYERQVVSWLQASATSLENFKVEHRKRLVGTGGEYEFDAVAEFVGFHEAKFVVLVECKRYSRPIEREKVMALWAKLQDTGAHKAIMFATCGFQSGALDYARSRGIATITFVQGSFTYGTKSANPVFEPPPWVGLPDFAGLLVEKNEGGICCSTIDDENLDKLRIWLDSNEVDT